MPVPIATAGQQVLSLAVALGIGLMLGVERERRKGRGLGRAPAGIRTFALVTLLGGLAYLVGGSLSRRASWGSPPSPPTPADAATTRA